MGNCIGKKSGAKNKHQKYTSSIVSTTKLYDKRRTNIRRTRLLSSTSSKQTRIRISHLPDVVESKTLFNDNEEKVIQSPISLSTTDSDEQFIFIHTSETSLPIELPNECNEYQTDEITIDFSEKDVTDSMVLITEDQDVTMKALVNNEIEINDDQEVPNFTEELLPDSIVSSPSPSLIDSTFSSLSYNTTPFSSQDQLIISSSTSSDDTHPILSSNQLINCTKILSLPYTEQIYIDNQSSNEIFSPILPISISRCKNNLFLNEFHQNIVSHKCLTLSSIIDDLAQQQFIRIHRRTKSQLIEHKQFECVQLNDINKFDKPPLIFDNDQKFVYITKYARWNEFQSVTCATKDALRNFSSCDHCLSIFSGAKLNQYLHPFLYANITYNFVQTYFNEINNNNNIFGYVSQVNSHYIQQTIINNSKLTYSYDLDVDHTKFYFVLRIQSWPEEIRSTFEQRHRLWPLNNENLFTNTCFIRFIGTQNEISTTDKCYTCDKLLSPLINSSWSYTYAAIENQLILAMSDEHIRFASIVWNYLHAKTHGQLSFNIFKHTLFYFFEQYSIETFLTSDLLNYIHDFIDFLSNCYQRKSFPHYFNSNYNFYNDNISLHFLTMKITYLDLKKFSVYLLPKSSLYLYHLMYLIEFQSKFLHYLSSLKTNLSQTILETHEFVIKQLSSNVKTSKKQFDSMIPIKSYRPLTLDCLYRYQEENVQIILDYLPLLREKEPSLLTHSLWSIYIQYFNSLFDDLFIS
ncbi:unnamed protein product [Adineta steineri]|uniref:Uncharacterized protein n=1 Tax=Adineta steineri TaxID=433720 RepID=A0A815WFK6_9BILA|nr:unnamed protein product [Adineta steineri]CAF1658356.1 unnamed protein product [Adineta steineri]